MAKPTPDLTAIGLIMVMAALILLITLIALLILLDPPLCPALPLAPAR